MTDNKKPPLGVFPEWLFEEMRIKELTKALYEYANYDIDTNCILMKTWAQELLNLLNKKTILKGEL